MGANQSGRSAERNSSDEEVNFDHFQILRAIGKGSFGKVCIVQKKDCKTLYAMKYMNKSQCEQREALKNVCREVEILADLDHPFLVNLWFSFQDEEDLFMVTDLLLGGDLRYHILQEVPFNEDCVKLYVIELAHALDYLQARRIVHRDVKPDNILLDEEGHAHLTDFNIAAVLEDGQLATSMSGTKPYMAPEIFDCAVDECVGYSFPVDWWSLGVVAYEMLSGSRPYDIHSVTSISDVRGLFSERLRYPAAWSPGIVEILAKLLSPRPGARLSSVVELRKMQCFNQVNFENIAAKKAKPPFAPPRDHLNCDPTFELEEMIIEARPLHKKKKRLAKQRSLRETQCYSIDTDCDSPTEIRLEYLSEYYVYNRERELAKRARENKESAWEAELLQAMRASEPTSPPAHPKQFASETRPHQRTSDQGTSNALDEGGTKSKLHIDSQIRRIDHRISQIRLENLSKCSDKPKLQATSELNVIDQYFHPCLIAPKSCQHQTASGLEENHEYNSKQLCKPSVKDVVKDQLVGNLEFIDRTPSPVERAATTVGPPLSYVPNK